MGDASSFLTGDVFDVTGVNKKISPVGALMGDPINLTGMFKTPEQKEAEGKAKAAAAARAAGAMNPPSDINQQNLQYSQLGSNLTLPYLQSYRTFYSPTSLDPGNIQPKIKQGLGFDLPHSIFDDPAFKQWIGKDFYTPWYDLIKKSGKTLF